MASVSPVMLPRFASLPATPVAVPPALGARLARFFLTPFADVDDRVARLAMANQAEREARQAAMSDADGSRRA